MAKVLVYTTPARGHLYPIVPTLLELADRGHDLSVRTLASQVETVSALGFRARPIDPAIEALEHDDYKARTPQGAIKRAIAVFSRRAGPEVADLRSAIAAEDPDVLLVDGQAWGALAAAEAGDLPWASWFPYPLPLPSPGVPPFGPGWAPAAGPAGRMRDRVLGPLLRRSFERVLLPPMNGVRADLGLAPIESVAGVFASAPLVLYLTAEPFEYPRSDWPPNIRLVGPGVWEPPSEPPAWLGEVDRPLVLVTTSSEFQDDGRLVSTALEALAGEPVHLVATLPAGTNAGISSGPHSHVLPFLPHGPVLGRAVCAVTHGGMGATQKALAAGVPVCAVPFGRDQLEVARRVVMAGAGSSLRAGRLNSERLRKKVREAMSKTAGARRVADGFARAGGARAGADAIEQLTGRPATSPLASP